MADKISKPPASALPEVDRQFATTLARGLGILRCFTSAEPALGNKEISTRTRLPKATISRLTYTLTKLGYLRQEKQSRKYQLGPAAVTFAYPVLASLRIRQIARKLMQSLADYSGGAVAMGMCDRLSMVYIEVGRQFNAVAELPDVDSSFAICDSSAGWSALSGLGAARRDDIVNRIKIDQPKLYALHSGDIDAGLESIRSLGYCISRFQLAEGITTVSAPLHGLVQGEVITFSCALADASIRKGWLEQDIGPRLVTMAHNVEDLYQADAPA